MFFDIFVYILFLMNFYKKKFRGVRLGDCVGYFWGLKCLIYWLLNIMFSCFFVRSMECGGVLFNWNYIFEFVVIDNLFKYLEIGLL